MDTRTRPQTVIGRLKNGLFKTSRLISEGITDILTKRKLDSSTLEDFEDRLLQTDLGVETTRRIIETLSRKSFEKGLTQEEVEDVLQSEIESVLGPVERTLEISPQNKPSVILVVGVNGGGKTTTIGKLTAQFSKNGKTVMLAAADTFRAAAQDQLKIWGERTSSEVISGSHGTDAASLAYEALQRARQKAVDVLLVDTAGRLQNKQSLMEELEKVVRVLKKIDASAPHDVLLVLDATTGQNALQQVELFQKHAGVTGLILTKLDGTARGGILVAIAAKYQLPVYAVGVGEGVDDLEPFSAQGFAKAMIHG